MNPQLVSTLSSIGLVLAGLFFVQAVLSKIFDIAVQRTFDDIFESTIKRLREDDAFMTKVKQAGASSDEVGCLIKQEVLAAVTAKLDKLNHKPRRGLVVGLVRESQVQLIKHYDFKSDNSAAKVLLRTAS